MLIIRLDRTQYCFVGTLAANTLSSAPLTGWSLAATLLREPVHRGCYWLGVVVFGETLTMHGYGPGRCLPGAGYGCPIVLQFCARLFAFLGSEVLLGATTRIDTVVLKYLRT